MQCAGVASTLDRNRKRSVAARRVSTEHRVAGRGRGRGTFGLHLGGPEGEVVAQELHDERRVLVALLVERVELRDRLVERALRQLARAVCKGQSISTETVSAAVPTSCEHKARDGAERGGEEGEERRGEERRKEERRGEGRKGD